MKKKPLSGKKLAMFILFFAIAFVKSDLVAGADIAKRYSIEDPAIEELCLNATSPSPESKRIQAKIIGYWTPLPKSFNKSLSILFKSIQFNDNGWVKYICKLKKQKISKKALYKVIHKATPGKLGGKGINIIISELEENDKEVILFIFTNATVDYDSRLPMDMGELLKFRDVAGNQFLFFRNNDKQQKQNKQSNAKIDKIADHNTEKNGKIKSKNTQEHASEYIAILKNKESSLQTRNRAILALMVMKDKSSVSALIVQLKPEQEFIIQQNVIRALGEIGDKQAIAPLLKILTKPVKGNIEDEGENEAILRRHAVMALGEIGSASSLHTLRMLVKQKNEYKSIREFAEIAIQKIMSEN